MNIIPTLVPALILLKVPNFIPITLMIVFFFPVIFQIVTGLRALRGKIKMQFGIICAISIVSQILATISLIVLMTYNLKHSGIRDGLGFLFVEILGLLMIAIILIVIGIQLLINRNRGQNDN